MVEQAKEAQRALELDPTDGAPWRVMAFASHYVDWDHVTAEAQFRKAMELRPRDVAALSWFAEFLIDLKRFDEAFVYARKAQEVAPRWLEPMTVSGNIHLFSGNHEMAIADYRRVLESEPNYGLANHFLGRAYLGKRQDQKAIDQLRKSNDLLGQVPFSIGDLGYALAVGGNRPEAERLLSSLITKREQAFFPAFAIAQIQLGLGQTTPRSTGSSVPPTNATSAITCRRSTPTMSRCARTRDFARSCSGSTSVTNTTLSDP